MGHRLSRWRCYAETVLLLVWVEGSGRRTWDLCSEMMRYCSQGQASFADHEESPRQKAQRKMS